MAPSSSSKNDSDLEKRLKQAQDRLDSAYEDALWDLQNNRKGMDADRLFDIIEAVTKRMAEPQQPESLRDKQLIQKGIELLYEVFKPDIDGKITNLPKLGKSTIANTLKFLLENPQFDNALEDKRIDALYNFIFCYQDDISPQQIKEISVKHPHDFNKLLARAIEKGDVELFNKLAAASPEAAHSALINADRMPQGFLEVLANQKSSDNNPTATALLSSLMLLQREHPITLQNKNPKDHKNKMALHDLIQRCPGKSATDIKKDIDATKWSLNRAVQSFGKDYSHNRVSRGPLNDGLDKISASVKPTQKPTSQARVKPTQKPTPQARVKPNQKSTPQARVKPNQNPTPQSRVKRSQPAGHSGLRADTQKSTPQARVNPNQNPTPQSRVKPNQKSTPQPRVKPNQKSTPQTRVKPNQNPTPQSRVKRSQSAGHSGLRADTQKPTPVPKAPKHN